MSSAFFYALQRLLVLSLILPASAESPVFAFAAQQKTQPPAATGQDPRIGQRVMVSKHGGTTQDTTIDRLDSMAGRGLHRLAHQRRMALDCRKRRLVVGKGDDFI
ncbi:MAG UNVERIFIED_CONTAM: hypothetical protein LVR18_33245 [Planctomycetaceae bacterium]